MPPTNLTSLAVSLDDDVVIDPALLSDDDPLSDLSSDAEENDNNPNGDTASPADAQSSNSEAGPSTAGPSNSSGSKSPTKQESPADAVEPPGWKPKKKRWVLISDSEDEDTPRKKSKSAKSQSGKGKARRSSIKGKGKEGCAAGDEKADGEGGKKGLVAKGAEWADIPEWKSRKDCPLLALPLEILDLCFGTSLKLGLTCRDYIALAGVSRYFRERFTDTVFREVLWHIGERHVERPKTKDAQRIFTRSIQDWRESPKRQVGPTYMPKHWMPRDLRDNWTEAHYVVYKEEQAHWRNERGSRIRQGIQEQEEAEATRRRLHDQTVTVNYATRKVIAKAKGRRPGDPPGPKDERGIPLGAVVVDVPDGPKKRPVSRTRSSGNGPASTRPVKVEESVSARIAKRVSESKRANSGAFVAPDSEYESDDEDLDETWHLDQEDLKVAKMFWPSKYRAKAVESAHKERINKTDAVKEYKVAGAELLCLKHVLVANPMNKTTPIQVFYLSAVQALAYRSHGGPFGHQEHVKLTIERAEKTLETRHKRLEKAKAEGTYVPKKKKHQIRPFDWKYRHLLDVTRCDDDECDCHDNPHGHGHGHGHSSDDE